MDDGSDGDTLPDNYVRSQAAPTRERQANTGASYTVGTELLHVDG